MKIAVCLHLFYTDMFDVITSYLNNLKYPYKLYVSLSEGFHDENIKKKILSFKPDSKIIVVKNKGVDIGGFLQTLNHLDQDTDLILKLHTKKGVGLPNNPSLLARRRGINYATNHGNKWFHELMKGVLSDESKINRIIEKFKKDGKCGMVGHRLYNNLATNEKEIINLLPHFNLNKNCLSQHFIGGTMFWVRYDIIKKYFTSHIIDHILNNTKDGYVQEPSIMHAVERIFGYIVTKENKNIIVVN